MKFGENVRRNLPDRNQLSYFVILSSASFLSYQFVMLLNAKFSSVEENAFHRHYAAAQNVNGEEGKV
jgi:hypothetical protein